MTDSKIALDKIQEAELQAQARVDAAQKEAQKIAVESGIQRERIIQTALVQAGQDCEQLKKKILKDAEKEISIIEKNAQEEIIRLRQKADKNSERAVDFLKNKLFKDRECR